MAELSFIDSQLAIVYEKLGVYDLDTALKILRERYGNS